MQTRETADLFLQLIIEVLADKGRAAVVLPDGTLFGEGVKTKIKKLLTEECNLHTIVRLPNGVFNPYTGIKTNILFFTKGQPTKEVWFYEHPYPDGVKNYSKTKPMKFEEFQAEIDWWGNEADGFASREENNQAWKVSIGDIITRNFNLDIKNPYQGETISHDPDELLAQYQTQQAEISELRNQLRDILGAAWRATRGELMTVEKLITDHIDIWSSALQTRSTAGRGSNGKIDLYGIKKLRELILELAVRGKLVPQDPNDEPASELLKRIAAEKAELVKQGKLKSRSRCRKLVRMRNRLSCRRVGVGEIGNFRIWPNWKHTFKINAEYFGNDVPFIKPADITAQGSYTIMKGYQLKGLKA
jgi:hypothetical protein